MSAIQKHKCAPPCKHIFRNKYGTITTDECTKFLLLTPRQYFNYVRCSDLMFIIPRSLSQLGSENDSLSHLNSAYTDKLCLCDVSDDCFSGVCVCRIVQTPIGQFCLGREGI